MLSIWGGFWEAFGRLWGGFWEGFGRVWEPFGHSWRLSGPCFALFAGVDCFLLVLDAFGGLGGVWGGFLLGFAGLGMTIREEVLLGAGPIAEASEASEQSERAKLSGACGCFLVVFSGRLGLSLAFSRLPLPAMSYHIGTCLKRDRASRSLLRQVIFEGL